MAKALSVNLASRVTSDAKEIAHMNGIIGKTTKRLHDMKAIAAASCVLHAVMHNNCTSMRDFLKAVGNAERHDAIVRWAVEVGPFKWEKDKDTKRNTFFMDTDKANAMKADAKALAELPAKLTANPYWVHVPPKEVPEFNFKVAFLALVKKAKTIKADPTRSAKAKFEGLDQAEQLRALLEKVA